MTKSEYKELLNVIRTSIYMSDISRESKREATEAVCKSLIKCVEHTEIKNNAK